jgi:hypothetical protein
MPNTDYAPSDQPLANFIVADAEAVLGRRITPEEARSIVKTLESALQEAFIDAVQSHGYDPDDAEANDPDGPEDISYKFDEGTQNDSSETEK